MFLCVGLLRIENIRIIFYHKYKFVIKLLERFSDMLRSDVWYLFV